MRFTFVSLHSEVMSLEGDEWEAERKCPTFKAGADHVRFQGALAQQESACNTTLQQQKRCVEWLGLHQSSPANGS